MYLIWNEFTKRHLDPPRTARVGKRWIESGQVKGKILDDTPWIDMDAWHGPAPDGLSETERQALDLLA